MPHSNNNMLNANPYAIIKTSEGVRLTTVQTQLLEQAYHAYAPSTVRRKLTTGKSGAEVYLIERNDHRLEIAKFDHPFGLQPELTAYKGLVTKNSPQYRVDLRSKLVQLENGELDLQLLQSGDGKLGILIYNFLGRGIDSADDSLLEYYKNKGGAETSKVLDHLFEAYGPQWWNAKTLTTIWYGEEYDRLLPVHLTLKRLRHPDPQAFSLQSGQIEWNQVRQLKMEQVVHLQKFEITECREDILRLHALSPQQEHSTDLRVKLDGLNPDQYQPGEILPDTYAEITETRAQLLDIAARKSHARFSADGTIFTLNGKRHANPLRYIETFLAAEPEANSSIIHGDLNLRNIMVHKPTGFVWLIDFAHTRSNGPTLFDLQRLEEHVIAEMVAPLMENHRDANDLVKVLNALHSEPLNPQSPDRKWQDAYTVLHKIRNLAKEYLPHGGEWGEYYRGLFLVFMGALKYERSEYQRDLLLVGAATVKALIDKKSNEPYIPQEENPMRTWLLGVATVLVLMLGIIIGTSNFVSVIIDQFTAGTATPTVIPTIPATAPPAATPSPELAASPTITPTVQGTWPPQNGTMLARIRDRGFLICGISGDIPGFSYIEEDADGLNSIDPDIVKNANLPEEVLGVLYDDATGLDVDYCRALAVAIWGQYWGKVAFLTLSLDENLPYYRFTAVEQGLVDVAFRNTTWNMRRELRVAFGPVIYYDSLKFMVDPEVLGGEQFKEAADAIKYLAARTEKICVLPGTTTVETMQNLFGAERIITDTIVNQKKEPFRLNGQLIEDYSTGECPIIASDEALLIAQQWLNKEKKNDNRLDKAVIIPQNQGTTFEPLAPFVAQGDSQWLNILNQVIWATMYAEQIGVTMEEIKLLKDDPNADPKIIEECIKNLAQKNALPEQNYKDFLGIQAGSFTQAKRPELGNIEGDYALQIIRQVGNYGEIFASNLGEKGFPRGSNCVWNPLKQLVTQPGDNPNEVGNPVTLEDKCRLVIPPL